MTTEEALAVLRQKLKRRRFLNGLTWRRKLCIAPPPHSISLTFREADALVALLEAAQPALDR